MPATATHLSEPVPKEQVVAIMPAPSLNDEAEMTAQVSNIELEAGAIVINTDEDYNFAAEFGRKLKSAAADVVAFFKPMKDAAHKAHKEICEREKIMLNPLKSAEDTLKRTMGDFALRRENERKAIEEEARKRAQEEADKKLDEALNAEAAGDTAAAANAMADAQMADSMSRNISVTADAPKAAGVSQGKDWEIVSVDAAQVPIDFNGVELRPVDVKAVARLIRASKGQIKIPGITYKETIKTSIRR